MRPLALRRARPFFALSSISTRAACVRYSTAAPPAPAAAAVPAGRRPIAVPTTPPPPPPSEPTFEPLERSIKGSQRGILLISIPLPPYVWGSHLEFTSPLLGAASTALKKRGIAVNAYYDGVGVATVPDKVEVYPATMVYPDGTRYAIQELSDAALKDLDAGELGRALAHTQRMDLSLAPPNLLPAARGRVRERPEILVCTHGARDCRCSDKGTPLVDALRAFVQQHKLDIPVREIAHVGGHKWAANALLVPSLDMLSNLTAADAPALVEHVANRRPTYSPVWAHWRGRFGMDAEAQARVWANIKRHLPPTTVFAGPTATAGEEAGQKSKGEAVRVPLKFRTFQGEGRTVQARVGDSLLAVGREHDLPSLEGTCGGNLECATCHLYIDPWAPIGPPSEEELDMLGTALEYRDGPSRLGCQIKVTPDLSLWSENGGVIDLPRY